MPQSLAKITVHLIFSTKNRMRLLTDEIRPTLHEYMGGILRDLECNAVEINTEPDHAHVLFSLSRTMTIAKAVGDLKKGSTLWLREQTTGVREFSWQAGYAAFSVSESAIEDVRTYIRNQREHHRKRTFQDEIRAYFQRHGIEFDERYVWD